MQGPHSSSCRTSDLLRQPDVGRVLICSSHLSVNPIRCVTVRERVVHVNKKSAARKIEPNQQMMMKQLAQNVTSYFLRVQTQGKKQKMALIFFQAFQINFDFKVNLTHCDLRKCVSVCVHGKSACMHGHKAFALALSPLSRLQNLERMRWESDCEAKCQKYWTRTLKKKKSVTPRVIFKLSPAWLSLIHIGRGFLIQQLHTKLNSKVLVLLFVKALAWR